MTNIARRGTDLTALRKMADDVESQGFRATARLYRQMAEEIEALHAQLREAVEAERERIVALIRREASETFDMQLDFEFRQLADRIASGGGAVAR
jgi:hypothetical protein